MVIDIEQVLLFSTYVMIISAILTFCGLSIFAAPYGKYSSSKGFGPLMPAQLAWAVMECPNLWVSGLVYYFRDRHTTTTFGNNVNKLALFLFLLHYVNRSIIYPLRMWSSACTPMPLSVMVAAFVFCSWNGFNQATSLILVDDISNTETNLIRCLVGSAVFLVGFYINVTSDNNLVNSKKQSALNNGGVSKYVIPQGGMFKYVSSANYCKIIVFFTKYIFCLVNLNTTHRIFHALLITVDFYIISCFTVVGEIMEWWGFAILCGTFTSFSFALYSTAYLSSRAIHVRIILFSVALSFRIIFVM